MGLYLTQGFHHITMVSRNAQRTLSFYRSFLGLWLRLIKKSVNQDDPDTLHYFWGSYDGTTIKPHSDLTLFGWPNSRHRAVGGAGQTHHIAFRTKSAEEQLGQALKLPAWLEGQRCEIEERLRPLD